MKKTFLFLTLFLTMLTFGVRAQVPVFTEGFEETSLPTGWTIIDADQDGNNWEHISVQGDLSSGHTGTGAYASYSYENATYDALTPDNWLVTPAIVLSGTSSLTYWFIVAQSYPGDHYGVYVSTTSATDTSAFTLLFEETPTAANGTWTMRTVDLTSYTGNTVYIAFRHFNCTDQFVLVLDDITVYSTSSESVLVANPEEISFGSVEINTTSSVETVQVIANNITEAISASVAAPFEISADNIAFGSTATLPVGGGDLYVRYAPTATGAHQDTLTITAGAFSQTVVLSGFCFDCSISTLPLFESFESVDGLSCWLAGNASSANPNSITISSQFATDGTHSLCFSSYSSATDYNQYVITPELPVTPSKIVSFDYKNSNTAIENFRVGYSTTTPAISAFTWKPGVASNSTDWNQYIASDIPGDAKYIAINYYSDWAYYLFVDSFMVQEGPECISPNELNVSAVSATTADLYWSSINGTYNIYYKAATDTAWTEVENLVLQDQGYTLTGLTPSTTYEWYVEIVCDDGSVSASSTATFVTACAPFTVTDDNPYVQDFSVEPECWILPTNGGTSWSLSSNHLGHDFGTYEVEAFSPLLDITNVSTPYLKFDQLRADYFGSGVADELYVYMRSATPGAETDWLQLRAYTDVASNWTFDSLPLPSGMFFIQLRFKAIGNGTSADGCYIDNVSVYNEVNGPACTPPAGLSASNITLSSADLSWTMTNDGIVNIYYKTAADEDYTMVENATLTNGVYVLEDLSASTTYEWYVGIICSDGSIVTTASSMFTTLCGAANAPYFQGFENLATNAIPSCWSVINPYQNYPGAISNYAYEGAQMLKFNNNYNSNTPQYAVMPEFADDINTLQVNFWCRREGANSGTFSVGYVTDPENGNTFTPILSITSDQIGDNDYHNYTVKFESVDTMPNVHYYITFRYECTTEWFWYLDNVMVMPIPDCVNPETLTATTIGTTSAVLGWWAGDANSFTLYYKPSTDSVYTALSGITLDADGTYTLGNLMSGTYYDWYVATECADGTLSPSFATGSFITQCMDIASVPVTWDFENNLLGGTSSYPLPSCWTKASNSNYPYVNMNYAHSGDYKLYFYNSYSNAFAVLPDIDTAALPISSLQVSLYAKMSSNSYQCAIELGVMTDPSDVSTFTAVASYDLTDVYTLYEFPLNSYNGNGKYVAFHVTSSGSAYNNTYVDDVTLEHVPACSRPMSLTSDPDITSATLSWVSTASNFNLYYKESTETAWQSDPNISLDNNNEFELTNLSPATAYDWYVETACEGTEPLSSAIAHFYTTDAPTPLPYQTTFATASDWNLINGTCTNYWTAGTPSGETASALFVTNNGTAAAYTKTASTVVMAEKLFAIPANTDSVLVEFDVILAGEGALTPYDYLKVFLAPTSENFEASTSGSNAQSSFSNAQYALDFSAYKSQTGGSANYPYVIHLTQNNTIHVSEKMVVPGTNGKAKLVFLWRNDNSGGNDPAAIIRNFSISESSDTIVDITDPTVSTAAASNIEQTTATLNATITNPDGVTITAKGFEWKATTGGSYTQVAGTGSGDYFTANLANLTPNTSYTYKAFITFNDTTVYDSEMTFTTLPEDTPEPCEAPTNLRETGEIIDKSIGYLFVVWDDHANASQWNLQYKLSSENNWTNVVVTGNPTYIFENLEAYSEYNLRVQAICDENNLSEWSNVLTATAQGVGINDYLLNSITLYPNPANDVVNVQCTMNNVQLEGVEVIDVYGKVVRTIVGANNYSPLQTNINVSGLASGMYFLRVTTDEGVVTKAFVKR